jgi:hypothetical protein
MESPANNPSDGTAASEKLKTLITVWDRAIQTQMHFAELSIKTRQVGMTVVGATLGLAIVLNRTTGGFSLEIGTVEVPITAVLCWTAAVVLVAIWLLDVGVYHRMLRGAVAFNEELEQKQLRAVFGTEKGLTEAISYFSRYPDARLEAGKYASARETRRHNAGNRISGFYVVLITALVCAGLALLFASVI